MSGDSPPLRITLYEYHETVLLILIYYYDLINKKKRFQKSTILHISTVYPLSTHVLSVPSLSQMIELQSFLNTQVV